MSEMTNQSEIEAERQKVVRDLTVELDRRFMVLARVLRTGRVGGQELVNIQRLSESWQEKLIQAMDAEAELLPPPSPAKTPAKHEKTRTESSSPGASSRPPQRRSGDDSRPNRRWRRMDAQRPGDGRLQWDVARFVGQQLLYYFVHTPALDSNADLDIHGWYDWVHKELSSFYDATILELLSGRDIFGEPAITAYRDSLGHARRHCHGPTASFLVVSKEFDDQAAKLPASRDLARRLAYATSETRREVLWRFIGDVKSIIEGVEAVLDNQRGQISWLFALVKSAKQALGTSDYFRRAPPKVQEKLSQAILNGFQRRVAGWLLDPGLLGGIADAAEYVKLEKRGEDDAQHADILEQTRRRLQAHAARLVRSMSRGPGDPWSGVLPLEVEQIVEDLWWRSFVTPDGRWNAVSVAAFCDGRRRALWNTPLVLDGRDRILRVPNEEDDEDDKARLANAEPQDTDGRVPVVVFGAGIAGLTAAHELAERGFRVTVVEATMARAQRQDQDGLPVAKNDHTRTPIDVDIGGLARTQWAFASKRATRGEPPVPTGTSGERAVGPFPGEHGYRLFPSFYRHVFDTMKRTPLATSAPDAHRTAFDQLQPTHQQVFARRSQFVPLSRAKPRSIEAFRKEYMHLVEGLGFPKRDMARFFFKLLRYLMTSSERREAEYGKKSLLEFFGPEHYSEGFLKAIKAAPQALVAMDAEHCDARTQGNVYLQLLLDQVLGGEYTDSTLRGPTSRAWFEHWYEHLRRMDVEFVNAELLSFDVKEKEPGQTRAHLVLKLAPERRFENEGSLYGAIRNARYYVMALDAVGAEAVTRGWNSPGVPSELRGFTSHVETELPGKLDRYDVVITFDRPKTRVDAEDVLRRLLDQVFAAKDDPNGSPLERSAFRNLTNATGDVQLGGDMVDEVKLQLWFQRRVGDEEIGLIDAALREWIDEDQAERFMSRQPEWVDKPTTVTTPRMPDDIYGDTPVDRFQTFTGIQYYFAQDFKLVRGHVYFPDTEWGLSAVSQSQFWLDGELPADVRGVLSVDIGDCQRKSSYLHKSLVECSPEQIAAEVWRQIQDSLRSTRGPTSVVTSLPLPQPSYYHLDENLVFTSDKGVLRANLTPFLVNNVGDWDKRPKCVPWVPGRPTVVDAPRTDATGVWQAPHGGYRVHAGKVVFCGTYMRTFTRMTTMEAANESARHAVNAILDHLAAHTTADSHKKHEPIAGDYCDIWDPEEHELEELDFFKRVDKLLFEAGKPHIADILQFDKIADLQHPDTTPMQALLAALGATLGSDWGVKPPEAAASLNGLMEVAKSVASELGAGYGGPGGGDNPLQKLFSLLGMAKGIARKDT